ncbi:MAG: exodeoxyribonuclease V subunit gamma, partial [Myxococcota bacterium]
IEAPGGRPRIPNRFADRPVRADNEVAEAFTALLGLLRGRLTAAEVLDVLRRDPVRARFGIAGDDLELVRRWITETGVCWGIDADHRAAHDQPAADQNTWRFGLDRLLLGYAMPGDGLVQFGDALPYDDLEGGEAVLLGRLADFCDALFTAQATLAAPRSPAGWRDELGRLLERLVARSPATAHQHELIRAGLATLAARAEAAGFAELLRLETVQAQLDDELQRGATAHGFLSGGVTICELLPMRSIPFKLVCLLGMNDDAFPRQGRPLGFDRIAAQPRPGDRSVRDDDRYLFLEALLAARQQLVISYVGQRITDNQPLPPSVVVQELLDTIERTFVAPDGQTVAARIVVTHPLQPFSPRYFRGAEDRLFSYSNAYRAGAAAL